MCILGLYLGFHYVRRFRSAFLPSTIFASFSGMIRDARGQFWEADFARRPENLNSESDEYKRKVGQNLLSIYMLTTGLYFVGERLREIASSRKLDLYFLASLLYTFLLTTIVFAIEYFGLERVAPGSFGGIAHPGFMDFVGFSFSTLMTADISALRPLSGIAQAGTYLQLFGSLLIIVLLVFVILTSIRERYNQDLDGVVNELKATSDKLGDLIEANYELTLAAAEAWLLEYSPDVMKLLLKLRHGEKRAKEITAAAEDERRPKKITGPSEGSSR